MFCAATVWLAAHRAAYETRGGRRLLWALQKSEKRDFDPKNRGFCD
jgi:hypothetical protein